MQFFVPTSNDPAHAQMLYDRILKRVGSEDHKVDPDRIFRIRFIRNGTPLTLAVDDSYREAGEDLFSPSSGRHRITSSASAVTVRIDGEPVQIDQEAVSAVEKFDP